MLYFSIKAGVSCSKYCVYTFALWAVVE